jgi:hypothetical protein
VVKRCFSLHCIKKSDLTIERGMEQGIRNNKTKATLKAIFVSE